MEEIMSFRSTIPLHAKKPNNKYSWHVSTKTLLTPHVKTELSLHDMQRKSFVAGVTIPNSSEIQVLPARKFVFSSLVASPSHTSLFVATIKPSTADRLVYCKNPSLPGANCNPSRPRFDRSIVPWSSQQRTTCLDLVDSCQLFNHPCLPLESVCCLTATSHIVNNGGKDVTQKVKRDEVTTCDLSKPPPSRCLLPPSNRSRYRTSPACSS